MMEETGQVFISVKEGKSFALAEPTDVYCIIELEQQKVRTSICASVSLNGRAEWSEGYTFDVTTQAVIVIKVWGQSASAPHGRLLGTAEIDSACAKNRAPVERWLPVKPRPDDPPVKARSDLKAKDEVTPEATNGEIFLRISYVNSTSRVGLADFTVLKLIGRGAFGRVMLVRKNDTGRLYAMKQLSKDHVLSLAAVTFTLTERHILKTYNHPFVVSLKFSFQTKGHLYMVLDYVGGGELFYHMAERGVFDENTVRFYAAQIILALGFLHDRAVTYRDLKPENLLLDIHGNICLCDFGLCKEQVDGENTFTLCGSPEYMAPEVLQGKGYGKSVDWWALGILIYEMLTGLPPFYSEDPVEMGQNILSAPIHFPDHLSKNIMGLIVQLLRRDPSRRLGAGPNDAEDIKAHPFFASVDWKKMIRKEIEPPFKPHLHGTLDVTYFDPNCTEMPVTGAVGSSAADDASNSVDPEDCFARFSFVAPSDLGSTPHHLRKFTVSPTPLSYSHLGALHSTSPVFPHSAAHTPTLLHPLQGGGGGIPRSQATFSLSNFATSIPSRNASPHSFTLEDGLSYEGSSPVFSSTPVRNFTPLHTSQPLPSTSNTSQSHSLHSSHPPINNPQTQRLPEPRDAPFPPRDPAHPLRDILPPSYPPDMHQEDLPPHPVEEPSLSATTPWTPSYPPPPHSLSSPTISTNASPATTPTAKGHLRFPLAASASSPDLLRSREDDKKDDKNKKDDKSSKKLGFMSSLFRKMK